MVINHFYNNQPIPQLTEDTQVANVMIPAGYINVTYMCQAWNRRVRDFFKNKSSQNYIEALQNHLNNTFAGGGENFRGGVQTTPLTHYVIENLGEEWERGTWAHPDLAFKIAGWIDAEFEVWIINTARQVAEGNFAPLTDEAEEAQKILTKYWKHLRQQSRALFRPMTDEFQNYWYEVGFEPEPYHYASLVDLINQLLFGLSAREIRQSEGILEGSQLTRDNFGEEALDRIAYMEKLVRGLMKSDDLAPEVAIYKAYDIMNVVTIDYWC